MCFLQLIRYKNAVILILLLTIIRYTYSSKLLSDTVILHFNTFSFILFILSIILIAFSGNIINDIYDVKTDNINKPNQVLIDKKIAKKNAFFLYYLFSILSIAIAFHLSFKLQNFSLIYIYVTTIFLLFLYAKKLKGSILIGNILIAFLTPLPIVILAFVDIPKHKINNHITIVIVTIYLLGFLLNFIRELIKDIQDYKGDKQQNCKTFTVIYGKKKSLLLIKIISVITLFILAILIFILFKNNPLLASYLLLFIVFPLLYLTFKTKIDNAKKMSDLLKITMLFGVFSILLIS